MHKNIRLFLIIIFISLVSCLSTSCSSDKTFSWQYEWMYVQEQLAKEIYDDIMSDGYRWDADLYNFLTSRLPYNFEYSEDFLVIKYTIEDSDEIYTASLRYENYSDNFVFTLDSCYATTVATISKDSEDLTLSSNN